MYPAQIISGEQLVKLGEHGAAVLLALAIMLACLAAILYLIVQDRKSVRELERTKLDAARSAKEEDAENQRTGALVTTLSTVIKANAETSDAIRSLASATKDSNDLARIAIEAQVSIRAENEKITRELVSAVGQIMAELAAVKGTLRGPVMVQMLDDLLEETAAIKTMLIASTLPSADGRTLILPATDPLENGEDQSP